MKEIIKIQTKDGKQFDTVSQAVRYTDDMYGAVLTTICHKLSDCDGKYVNFSKFVDENLEMFLELVEIRSDLKLEKLEFGKSDCCDCESGDCFS